MTRRGRGWHVTVCSLLSRKLQVSTAATVAHGPPLEITHVWLVWQGAQSRYCVTPVIQVTVRHLCLS